MNIAFLHYHTKKGGVTTVIGQQISVLRDEHRCILIKGEEGGVDFGVPSYVVPGLAYDKHRDAETDPETTADEILSILDGSFEVLHIHNPLLKKNKNLIRIIRRLKERGVHLFLHIHDFAEDGRPGVYFKEDAYPDDVHYGVINTRDYALLSKAGLREQGLHYLPNMVSPLPYGDTPDGRDLVLYPVRGIRRKNLGEILLLSLFIPEGLSMGITLPPNSPGDRKIFEHWRETAAKHRLPVLFNLGTVEDFSVILGRTRFVVTTSIKEGFGFSYLEPWTIGKEVRGRYLDAVCPDFEKQGISFGCLYRSFTVPAAGFDRETFRERWTQGVTAWAGNFGMSLDMSDIERCFEKKFGGEGADFGSLDETAQTRLIEQAAGSPELRQTILTMNPWLADFFADSKEEGFRKTVEANRRIILKTYGPDEYKKRLLKIYKKLSNHVPHGVEKKKVLDAFMDICKYLPLGS